MSYNWLEIYARGGHPALVPAGKGLVMVILHADYDYWGGLPTCRSTQHKGKPTGVTLEWR